MSISSLPQQDWRADTAGLGNVTSKEHEYLKKKEMEALLWAQVEAEKLEGDKKKEEAKKIPAPKKVAGEWAQPQAFRTWWL